MEKSVDDLKKQVRSSRKKLSEIQTSRDDEKKRADALYEELGKLRQAQKDALVENEALKAEVQKGVEKIASALGEGYPCCLDRVSKAGFSIKGHSFSDYVRDYAASQHNENGDPADPGDL